MALDSSQIVASKGDATGRISGFNHLILFVDDMTKAIGFYRDLLGLKIIKTLPELDLGDTEPVGRNYFFQMPDGTMIGLNEYPSAAPPSRSIFTGSAVDSTVGQLWPGEKRPLQNPQKVDHISFGVETRDDLSYFRSRLFEAGVEVSEVIEFKEKNGAQFVMSIYFYDPFGNPLEISTWDSGDPKFEERLRRDLWYADEDPPAALLK
jgi:catechol 2,3-dioxygenase-like lactoylglutathione lyase family enzyme